MDNKSMELYNLWCEKAKDESVKESLDGLKGNEGEIYECFYKNLEFGTAGLRGILGAGTNRMNVYTVGQATQGLADYVNSSFENPSVVIGYDSRIKSDEFAKETARVIAANGIKVYLFPELIPTPVVSFAVRELKCSSGVIITASHNPSKYNGYKCYDPNGYQMTDEAANKVYGFINKTDIFADVKRIDFEQAVEQGIIEYVSQDLIEKFLTLVQSQSITPVEDCDLKVIYTPLNGAGNKLVREILNRIGIKNIKVVPQQEMPDGNFPTCTYPNPEVRQAYECAIEMAKDYPADILLATDPDCDRVGIAVRDNGEYRLISGNEMGAILLYYILSQRKANGTLPSNPLAIKTIVSTNLYNAIGEAYGCEIVELLTGFKYIGECITALEARGESDRFVMGYEESYGYLAGIHARDKDAVVASMLICEMAAFYNKQGKSLVDVLADIHAQFGIFLNQVDNFTFEGSQGMVKMAQLMDSMRSSAPEEIAGFKVTKRFDYKLSECVDCVTGEKSPITLPKSNVLLYKMGDCAEIIFRPSGTEPKIKAYITARAETMEKATQIREDLRNYAKDKMA